MHILKVIGNIVTLISTTLYMYFFYKTWKQNVNVGKFFLLLFIVVFICISVIYKQYVMDYEHFALYIQQ